MIDDTLHPVAREVRDNALRAVMAANDRTGDTQEVLRGFAIAFGMVLKSVQPKPGAAATWSRREARRMDAIDAAQGLETKP